jgi:hypothetical protein
MHHIHPKAPKPPKASRTPQNPQTSIQQKVGGTNWRRTSPNGWLKMCLAPIEEPQGAQITKSISHTSKPANIHPAKGGWHQLAIQQKVGGTN